MNVRDLLGDGLKFGIPPEAVEPNLSSTPDFSPGLVKGQGSRSSEVCQEASTLSIIRGVHAVGACGGMERLGCNIQSRNNFWSENVFCLGTEHRRNGLETRRVHSPDCCRVV
jgi:hypothetical protein